jgi:hypothetical protein
LLSRSGQQVTQEIGYLVKKKYLLSHPDPKRNQVGVQTYKTNPAIEPLLPELRKRASQDAVVARIADRITPTALRQIGYTEELQAALVKVSSAELQEMLRRDLLEAAIARLADSHKSCLVLCGSLIEAIILDKLVATGVLKATASNGKAVSVYRMDLGDLLFVAKQQDLVDDQMFHFGHALRGFRNIIHPGVERRRTALQVNSQNARIAWDIATKLILEM